MPCNWMSGEGVRLTGVVESADQSWSIGIPLVPIVFEGEPNNPLPIREHMSDLFLKKKEVPTNLNVEAISVVYCT